MVDWNQGSLSPFPTLPTPQQQSATTQSNLSTQNAHLIQQAEANNMMRNGLPVTVNANGVLKYDIQKIGEGIGVSSDRVTELQKMMYPTQPEGYSDTSEDRRGMANVESRIGYNWATDEFKGSIEEGPEAFIRNLSLMNVGQEMDLNDPNVMGALATQGTLEGMNPARHSQMFREQKDNFVSKWGKNFLGPAVGVVLGAATMGAASPIGSTIGAGMVSGVTGSAASQAIHSGIENIDWGDVGRAGVTGSISGGLGPALSGIEQPLLQAGAQGIINSATGQIMEGDFNLQDFATNAALSTGMNIAGNAIHGGIEGYRNPNDTALSGAYRNAVTGGPSPEYVNLDEPDFNDQDAQNFGPLSSHTNLAGFPGYNPSEDESLYNVDDTGQSLQTPEELPQMATWDTGSLESNLGNMNSSENMFGDGELVNDLGGIAINSALAALMPGSSVGGPTSSGSPGIASSFLPNLLGGGGSNKEDKFSDLQVRGLGI